MNRLLTKEKSEQLLRYIGVALPGAVYDAEKHRLELLPDQTSAGQVYFRLPLNLPYPGHKQKAASGTPFQYVILLIQAGNCALGYFEDGHNLHHKVFRSYMVRKKQGTSQIKYLKTKGKSRAGSRVRLGESAEFFENINTRLQAYFEEHEVQCIAISCSKTLLPYLYHAKTEPPFTKNDPRLYKIPKHIHTPIYEVLLDANQFLLRGELIYEEAQTNFAMDLLVKAGIAQTEPDVDDDEDELDYENA